MKTTAIILTLKGDKCIICDVLSLHIDKVSKLFDNWCGHFLDSTSDFAQCANRFFS